MHSTETCNQVTHAPTELQTPHLSEEHHAMLAVESAISPDVIAARGYYTATKKSEIPHAFKSYQRRIGCVMPAYSPDGVTTSVQLKPNNPRLSKKAKPVKYETPANLRLIVDVHPFNAAAVKDPSIPLWITEGLKKSDSLTSQGLCAVALFGVYGWKLKGHERLLPCFDHIALEGRDVYVVFDSDVTVKPEVQDALQRLIPLLQERGADG